MTATSEEWVFENIQQLDFGGLNGVAKILEIPIDEINNAGTKISLLKVVLRYLSSVELDDLTFKNIETFIQKHYHVLPFSSPKLPEKNENLLKNANELNKKTFNNSFEQFQRGDNKNDFDNYQTFVQFKEFKKNGKIRNQDKKRD